MEAVDERRHIRLSLDVGRAGLISSVGRRLPVWSPRDSGSRLLGDSTSQSAFNIGKYRNFNFVFPDGEYVRIPRIPCGA